MHRTKYDPLSASIVRRRNRSESLLSCSVLYVVNNVTKRERKGVKNLSHMFHWFQGMQEAMLTHMLSLTFRPFTSILCTCIRQQIDISSVFNVLFGGRDWDRRTLECLQELWPLPYVRPAVVALSHDARTFGSPQLLLITTDNSPESPLQ